jgi:hypothetical protein
MKYAYLKILLMFTLAALCRCDNKEDFIFDVDLLVSKPWGIPQVIEPGTGSIDLDAPTIFYEEGYVEIGPAKTDFWSLRSDRTIFLEQAQETWFIIDLSEERLYVEKNSFPDGTFIVKCIYYPFEP